MAFTFTLDLQEHIYRGHIAGMEEVFARYTKEGAKERFTKYLKPYKNLPKRTKTFKREIPENLDIIP